MSFFTDYLATAKKAAAQTGVLVSVILAQWTDETGGGGSKAFVQGNNFAGVTLPGSSMITGVTAFPNKVAGLDAYITTLQQPTYAAVLKAAGWKAQCIALGKSPWAGGHYDANGYYAGKPYTQLNWGIDLITRIENNNLTQYDTGSSAGTSTTSSASITTLTPESASGKAMAAFHAAYGAILAPTVGFSSTISTDDIQINGTGLSVDVSNALITTQLDLALTKTSTMTLTLHDPTRKIINAPEFNQASLLQLRTLIFQLVSVEKEGSVLTCTFESWVVAALGAATGAFTIAPGTMTRTDFAGLLVGEIDGATFTSAPASYLSSLDEGYAHTNKEQLSRGTVDTPLENSWTCLQRLASEIQWVCFESFGTVYFGPYSYLTSVSPVFLPREFSAGVTLITGTYDVGQPLGELTITCVADSWFPNIGQCVQINDLGPFNGNWIVSEMERTDIMEPTITITLQQPLPGLPEPTTGGSNPAVGSGAGDVQSTGGRTAAKKALAFCLSKVGHPYSETVNLRLGPTYYDCSGLVYEAYLSVGINITTTTFTQWPTAAGSPVPAGINNLLPGDLLYFGYGVGQEAQHVAMVDTINKTKGTVHVVQAADPAQGVNEATMTPTIGAHYGTTTLVYLGALRPSP